MKLIYTKILNSGLYFPTPRFDHYNDVSTKNAGLQLEYGEYAMISSVVLQSTDPDNSANEVYYILLISKVSICLLFLPSDNKNRKLSVSELPILLVCTYLIRFISISCCVKLDPTRRSLHSDIRVGMYGSEQNCKLLLI
jgi:hypothetical protein